MNNFHSGNYQVNNREQISEYKSFLPEEINKSFTIQDQSILLLLEEATKLLSEVNTYTKLIPDINYFIQMHIKNEAVNSSKIEGTKTEIDEILLPKEEINPERRDDWSEVKNYIEAINWSIKELKKLPISVRLLKKTHKILLSGVRGKYKLPGELRVSQNWIGGSSIRTARFVPPQPKILPSLLSDWEKFWHNNSLNIPVLIKIAVMHYQFETIHPFLDRNGRLGRLFITLQLIEKDFLNKPTLYISSYFEKFRQSYYESLDEVRRNNDLESWIKFFLEGIIQTSIDSKKKFKKVIALKQKYEERINTLGRKVPRAKKLLLYLFSQPIITIDDVNQLLDTKFKASSSLIKNLIELDILEEQQSISRRKLFRMKNYISLFKK